MSVVAAYSNRARAFEQQPQKAQKTRFFAAHSCWPPSQQNVINAADLILTDNFVQWKIDKQYT